MSGRPGSVAFARAVRRRAGARRADGREPLDCEADGRCRDAVADVGDETHQAVPALLRRSRWPPNAVQVNSKPGPRPQRRRATTTEGAASMPSQLPSGRLAHPRPPPTHPPSPLRPRSDRRARHLPRPARRRSPPEAEARTILRSKRPRRCDRPASSGRTGQPTRSGFSPRRRRTSTTASAPRSS